MILEKIQLPELKNYTGRDIDNIQDFSKHLPNFNHRKVVYNYNSRGFRDDEWPSLEVLSDCVWCIGDSFTVGAGSDFYDIWPKLLENKIKTRTINVSMDGASNMWIKRKATNIINEIKPKNMVIMWSYVHRRESEEIHKTDLQRRLWHVIEPTNFDMWHQDYVFFSRLLKTFNKVTTNVIHLMVPNAYPPSENDKYNFTDIRNYLGKVTQLDTNYDNFHFGLKTGQAVVDQIIPLLTK